MNLSIIPLSFRWNHETVALLVLPKDNTSAILIGNTCKQLQDRPTIVFCEHHNFASISMSCRVCCPCTIPPMSDFPTEFSRLCEENGIRRVISCDGGNYLSRMVMGEIEFVHIHDVGPSFLEIPYTFSV